MKRDQKWEESRSHERAGIYPNLYIEKQWILLLQNPRTGKEFGLGRDRRNHQITEAIQANIELFSGHKHNL
ncbi:phage integrase Arm DNA-binding domain-containing protein [Escherichia coli]|nr:phage integrase Arm DNA-binding domain-containing protein [Escherichia coli]